MPTVTRHTTARAFLEQTEAALARDEVANNLMLGVALRTRDEEDEEEGANVYLTVYEGARLLGAALRTPPWNVIIHVEEDAAARNAEIIALLVDALHARGENLSGVTARTPHVEAFAAQWARVAHVASRLTMRERVFKLTEVVAPRAAPGQLRQATLADLPVASRFFADFISESMPEETQPNVAERVRRAIESGRLYLWLVDGDDGRHSEVVSMVGTSRGLPTGRAIGPVYTPPPARGKGYASNATAALSQQLLDEGYLYCTLFTDLSNPTSNHIYQQIGYQPICDYAMYAFDDPASS